MRATASKVPSDNRTLYTTFLADDVNFEELARSCDDFNGAQLKAVCVEAGMLALRREAEQVRFPALTHTGHSMCIQKA